MAVLACSDSPTQPIPDAVVVAASATTVRVGEDVALTASYQFGAENDAADGRVRWTSSDTTSFIVSEEGVGHAVAYTGVPVTVTATASGVAGTVDVFVLPAFDSLVVTTSAKLTLGRTVRPTFAVSAIGVYGRYYTDLSVAASRVELTSSNPQTVAVAADGTLHAAAIGQATITASLAGDTTRVLVDVFGGFPLTVLAGSEGYAVRGVNDSGDIIATRPDKSNVLRHGDAITDLGACVPRDINDADQVACAVTVPCDGICSTTQPGLFANGALTLLPDASKGGATGVSESGAAFGVAGGDTMRLFLWTPDGVTHPSQYPGWSGSTYAVNEHGHGIAVNEAAQYPTSWIVGPNSARQLASAGGRWAQARDINDADDAVGTSERMRGTGPDVGGGATIWRAANNWKPENPSYRAGDAVGITESTQVVGNGSDGVYVWEGGRYSVLADALAEEGWTLSHVSAVSRHGIVAAVAHKGSGANENVLVDIRASP